MLGGACLLGVPEVVTVTCLFPFACVVPVEVKGLLLQLKLSSSHSVMPSEGLSSIGGYRNSLGCTTILSCFLLARRAAKGKLKGIGEEVMGLTKAEGFPSREGSDIERIFRVNTPPLVHGLTLMRRKGSGKSGDPVFSESLSADHLIGMKFGMGILDDMNHLKNKRIRSVADLLQDQFGLALVHLENMDEYALLKNQQTSLVGSIGVDSASAASCHTGVIQYVVPHVPPLLRSFPILNVKHHEQQDVEVRNSK
ncbi:hypothetical protein G4B88_020107 [Cannabis sativa]|uniref:RNA polymerase Rpb2 domain-containing protein n=1 Tax=Cannabis sativa TaxID=3483 RepID=A0A7J6GLJ6_CANSA|nr:hypothetical protein G4B88_020107 [Cannabis sativa]